MQSPKDYSFKCPHVIEQKIRALWSMPMFHLMLGGRELFHSNFIAWLLELENDPLKLREFLGIADWPSVCVAREKSKLDILLTDQKVNGNNDDGDQGDENGDGSEEEIGADQSSQNQKNGRQQNPVSFVMAIENKYGALPSKSQLRRYDEDVFRPMESKSQKKGREISIVKVLLSLDPPHFELSEFESTNRQLKDWQWLSYERLVQYLRKNAIAENLDEKCRLYVCDYCDMVSCTSELLCELDKHEKESGRVAWFDHEGRFKQLDDLLRKYRLAPLIQKRRASKFAIKLKQAFEERNLAVQFEDDVWKQESIAVGAEFTRSTPLVSVAWCMERKSKNTPLHYKLGLQIQGHSYRRAFWSPNVTKEENNCADRSMNVFEEGGAFKVSTDSGLGSFDITTWWSDMDGVFTKGALKGHERTKRPSLNSKTNSQKKWNNYTNAFFYQHVKIGSDRLSPNEIVNAVLEDMSFARDKSRDWSPVSM